MIFIPEPTNPADWLYFCEEAAAEAYGETNSKVAASQAFIAAMPPLTHIDNVRAYIATVAAGVSLTYIGKDDAKLMMFMAQTALSAHSRRLRPTVSLTSRAVSQ